MNLPTQHRRKPKLTAAKSGYGYRWQQYRRRFLRAHPLCEACLKDDKLEAANEVDHIIPVEDANDPLFWDPKNHQALSKSCHSKKTARDRARGLTR